MGLQEDEKLLDAIVIGCNYANILGVVKSIGEGGYRVGLIRHTTSLVKKNVTPDMASKYVSKGLYVDRSNDTAMLEALIDEFNSAPHKPALVAADDFSASFLERYFEQLEPYYRLTRWENNRRGLTYYENKEHQKQAALACGLAVAKGFGIQIPRSIEHLEIPEGLIYPCILKPELSAGTGMSKALIQICQNEDELVAYFSHIAGTATGTILAEEYLFIEAEFTVPGLRFDGETAIPSFIEKIVTGKGKVAGLTVVGRVEASDSRPELKERIEALAAHMGIVGMFDVEIIQANGIMYFNEINPRSSAATYGNTGAGVNLPKMVVDYLLGRDWHANNFAVADPPLTFINEKPALQCYAQDDITYDEFCDLCNSADIHLLTGNDDPASKAAFETYIENRRRAKSSLDADENASTEQDEFDEEAEQQARIARQAQEIEQIAAYKEELSIEQATPEEVSDLAAALEQAYAQISGKRTYFSLEKLEEQLTVAQAIGAVFKAVHQGELVGIAAVMPVDVERWFHSGTATKIVHFIAFSQDCPEAVEQELMREVKQFASHEGGIMIFSAARRHTPLFNPLLRSGFNRMEMQERKPIVEITLARWADEQQVGAMMRRHIYTNSMLGVYLHKKVDPDSIRNPLVRDIYKRQFYRYMRKADEDTLADMLAAFNQIGATPKEYHMLSLADLSPAERNEYLTVERAYQNEARLRTNADYSADAWQIVHDRWKTREALTELVNRDAMPITDIESYTEFVNSHDRCKAKPLDSLLHNVVRLSSKTSEKRRDRLFEKRFSLKPYLIEEDLPESADYELFHKDYENSVRIVTYFDTEPRIVFGLLSIDCTRNKDEWLYEAPRYAAIDIDSGTICSDLVVKGKTQRESNHPRTGIDYANVTLPDWQSLTEQIKQAASRLADVPIMGWDVRYTLRGWTLDEIVMRPSYREAQIALQCGLWNVFRKN